MRESSMLTCLTIVTGLSDYIDGQCSFWVRMQFRLHLGLCAMCRTYLRQFKLTIEAVRRLGDGRLADLVIDATGNHLSMVRALEFAAFAGRVVYVGITSNKLEYQQAPVLHRRELSLLASRNALPGDFTRIIRLIQDGSIDTRPWITHVAPFEAVPRVFDSWIDPASGVVKAMIEVSGDTD